MSAKKGQKDSMYHYGLSLKKGDGIEQNEQFDILNLRQTMVTLNLFLCMQIC